MEENKEQSQATEQGGADVETLRAELETQYQEKYKAEIAGLNRRNSELEKTLNDFASKEEELKKQAMGTQEKLEYELQQLRTQFQTERAERTRSENRAKALEVMTQKGIDPRYLDFVPLDSSEAMVEKLELLAAIAGEERQKGAKSVVEKLGTPAPTGGVQPKGQLSREEYNALPYKERMKALDEGRVAGFGRIE